MEIAIIGAGPAGLSAAYELTLAGRSALILEADPEYVGGLSRTVERDGFRFDIGGHRFFSKNREVEALWHTWMGPDLRPVDRCSRILYRGRCFDYPLKPVNAFLNLGLRETLRCIGSYLWARVSPPKSRASFEDWMVARFGRRLFQIFFQTYTEKVWGIPCREISADWAVQRIRGLSLAGAVLEALGLRRSGLATLSERFVYPRLGPGMMWERVAERVQSQGCRLLMGAPVRSLKRGAQGIESVNGHAVRHVISSMPLGRLVQSLDPSAPEEIVQAARDLKHRDFLTVGLKVRAEGLFPDQWLYVHDPDVKAGRVQNYGNWSREMVPPGWTGLGVEYFCSRGDALWEQSDEALIELAGGEMVRLGLVARHQVQGGVVLRIPDAYPVYDRDYRVRVERIRAFLAREAPNLQVVGRNGMHRYNNQDHAMMTGILAARNLLGDSGYDLWRVNSDAEYLEETRLVPERLQ